MPVESQPSRHWTDGRLSGKADLPVDYVSAGVGPPSFQVFGTPSAGQVPVWNATTGRWEPGTPSGGGGLAVDVSGGKWGEARDSRVPYELSATTPWLEGFDTLDVNSDPIYTVDDNDNLSTSEAGLYIFYFQANFQGNAGAQAGSFVFTIDTYNFGDYLDLPINPVTLAPIRYSTLLALDADDAVQVTLRLEDGGVSSKDLSLVRASLQKVA